MLHSSAVYEEEEIRAIAPDRIVGSSRVLTFPPRVQMTDEERLRRLHEYDPISAAMIDTAIRRLYALRFPDE